MTWQPIETAPKDGTPILVCRGNYWDATDFFFPTAFPVAASWRPYHPNAKGKECWRDAHGHKLEPKFWMPVPPDPSGNSNKSTHR